MSFLSAKTLEETKVIIRAKHAMIGFVKNIIVLVTRTTLANKVSKTKSALFADGTKQGVIDIA